jgi:polysaccharide biosynthesis protein PslG
VAHRLLTAALIAVLAGIAAAPASARPAADIAGVAVHPWMMRDPETLERTFAGIADTGVRTVRVDLRWVEIEKAGPDIRAGRGNWAEMDAIAAAAQRHGLQLLPIVAYSPPWASPQGDLWAYPDRAPFEEFFAAALRRYPQIGAWEIWNEPNSWVFSKPGPSPTGFVDLLRSARETRDAVGSHAKLIAGGAAPGGAFGALQWIDAVARLGGLDLVDGLGIHPYSPQAPDDPSSLMMRLPALHDHLAELGKGDLPLWITEYGAPTATAPSGYGAPLSEAQQADRLRRAYALAAQMPWVENLTWFEYRDSCVNPVDPECNFGLVRNDFSPKLAYGAFRDVIAGRTPRLRPRLVLDRRVARGRRVTLAGRLMLPGAPALRARVLLRAIRRGSRSRTSSATVRHGVFRARIRAHRAGRWLVVARYPGSRAYQPAVARAWVRLRRASARSGRG